MATINWNSTKEEDVLIGRIAERAIEMGLNDDRVEVMMDITAVHLNDCKLDLKRLLDADDFNFAHDVNGIRGHIDVNTGKLTMGFLPRTARVK